MRAAGVLAKGRMFDMPGLEDRVSCHDMGVVIYSHQAQAQAGSGAHLNTNAIACVWPCRVKSGRNVNHNTIL